jgi:hypothetical protein
VIPGISGEACRTTGDAGEAILSRPAHDQLLGVSVVVCAHTELRWKHTCAALNSVLRQRPKPAQVLLIVDHNAELAARARRELVGVSVMESDGMPGLSGARNAGLRAATQPITVFLDDDAEARTGWLTSLVTPYSDARVMGTGGSVYPRWSTSRPAWLPPVFDWVVGCSYLGLPDTKAPVRNPIGANMSLRTTPAIEAGGFNASLGRSAKGARGCEETELAIRLTASQPNSVILYVPAAAVDHHVGEERLKFGYFLRRCWHEGLSKSTVVRLAGSAAGLERERRHVAIVIPMALLSDMRRFATGDLSAFMRITLVIAGLVTTTAGYLAGCTSQAKRSRM